MRQNLRLEQAFAHAERNKQCLRGITEAEKRALRRRAKSGELVRVRPGLYARTTYWETLSYHERIMHMLRSVTSMHTEWVLAGVSAAAVWGLADTYKLHTRVYVAVTRAQNSNNCVSTRFIVMASADTVSLHGIKVTGLMRTLFDCARLLPFREAIVILDKGLALLQTLKPTMRKADVMAYCKTIRCANLNRALFCLDFANPLSESGGESIARAALREWGYLIPQIQAPFRDPVSGKMYRADFLWNLPDRRQVIGELDGKGKYTDPAMTNGQSMESIILREKDRESNLSLTGNVSFVRFSYAQLINEPKTVMRKLDLAGIPRIESFPTILFED